MGRTPIAKGWSGVNKYLLENGRLLRVMDPGEVKRRDETFDVLGGFSGLPVPKAYEKYDSNEGACIVLSYAPGAELRDMLPALDARKQYALGVEAGRILRRLHEKNAPLYARDWNAYFPGRIAEKRRAYLACGNRLDGDAGMLDMLAKSVKLGLGRESTFQHGDYHDGNMVLAPDGHLEIIDFGSWSWGDPWEDFDRLLLSASYSELFACGEINGYFEFEPPADFFPTLAMYISVNVISSQSWSLRFGRDVIERLRGWGYSALKWFDGFKTCVPSWYGLPKFSESLSELKCRIAPPRSREKYKFTVTLSEYRGKILLSRHSKRNTWETQGGHVENGETVEQTARRELYEECGAADFDMEYLCDYYGYNDVSGSWGAVFTSHIRKLDALPKSEMAEVRAFSELPENLTYPNVTRALFEYAAGRK